MRTSNVLLALILVGQLAHLAISAASLSAGLPGAAAEVIIAEDRTQRTPQSAGDYSDVPVVQCAALPQQQRYLATMIVDGIAETLERELRLLAVRLSVR